MMIGLSIKVSKSAARNVLDEPLTGRSAVSTRFHAAGSSMRTSCGRAARSTSVMKVGAPFSIANEDSTQLFLTVISRL